METEFKKDFELAPGDRVAITIDYVKYTIRPLLPIPVTARVVLTCDHYQKYGWFIELEKDNGGGTV